MSCRRNHRHRGWGCGLTLGLLLLTVAWPRPAVGALPRRLVVALDSVAHRDMAALQQGVTYQDHKGRWFHRQAFTNGYFPASRLVSTFPSASDVAWTAMFGNCPLPGYQRSYFSKAANQRIRQNGVTTTMEYERQMTWQVASGYQRAVGYVWPRSSFDYEVREMVKAFLKARDGGEIFYALMRTTDDAQHMSVDIFALLSALDKQLEELRRVYRAREGRELEILLLSDHANNHAGPARRIEVRSFLKAAGYRLAEQFLDPKDVVLPTVGMESWVEIHSDPVETIRLARRLWRLPGVDIISARDPERTNQFLVINARGEEAVIDWKPAEDSYRYTTRTGDPLEHRAARENLARRRQLDPDGFGGSDAWMAETMTARYPLALERIVAGHTRGSLNEAAILISLDNAYVHSSALVKKGSELMRFGGTHGGLDDLNSTGMLLSNFVPTHDTSAERVAADFDGFPGLRDYRAEESGAELIAGRSLARVRIPRSPIDRTKELMETDQVCLRVWAPVLAGLARETPLDLSIRRIPRYRSGHIRRGDPDPERGREERITLADPLPCASGSGAERVYYLPRFAGLEPNQQYVLSGSLPEGPGSRLFRLPFRTGKHGWPVAY